MGRRAPAAPAAWVSRAGAARDAPADTRRGGGPGAEGASRAGAARGAPAAGDAGPGLAHAAGDAIAWPCLSARGAATRIEVSAVPNARRTGADGVHDGALRVRIAAAPADGRANELLIAWLASELGVPRRAVRLLRGASARRKTLEIDVAPEQVGHWLALRLDRAAGVK